MARIVEHLSVEEVEARYRAARDVTAAQHTQAIWLLAQGRAVLAMAGVLALAPRWVEQLAARCNPHGPEGLPSPTASRWCSCRPIARELQPAERLWPRDSFAVLLREIAFGDGGRAGRQREHAKLWGADAVGLGCEV